MVKEEAKYKKEKNVYPFVSMNIGKPWVFGNGSTWQAQQYQTEDEPDDCLYQFRELQNNITFFKGGKYDG